MERMEQGALSQLVRDSQAGDPQARERLVLSVQDYVHFYCRVMTENPDDAMDAAQDILIAMLTGLNGLKDPEAFWGWLRQIVLRTCRKRSVRTRREQGRQRSLETLLEEPDSGPGGPPELEELVERQEVRQAVMDLVNALPPQQRMCVLLFYYEEMPVEDIAAALHVPEGTVKSRLYYARKAIRRGAERSARQGLPLYGLQPLPLLGAVLRWEAEAAAGSAVPAGLAQAVLAAGGTAAGMTAKAVLGFSAGKKAALAGLALAAAVTGGVLLIPEAPAAGPPAPPAVQEIQPSQPTPPAVQEVQLPEPAPPQLPQEPEDPVRQETLAQPETAGSEIAKPAALPAVPVNQTSVKSEPSAPLETPPSPQEEAPDLPEIGEPFDSEPLPPQEELGSEPLPDDMQVSLSKPDAPPETKPEPAQPSWDPGFNPPPDVPQPIIPPEPEDPEPDEPEPDDPKPVDPAPEEPEPVGPAPEKPEPAVTTLIFEDEGGNGGYGHTYDLAYVWGDILPDGPLTYSSTAPSVVSVNDEGVFTTLAPGYAVLSASMDEPAARYDLEITVADRFRWQYWLPDITIRPGEYTACGPDGIAFSNLHGYEIKLVQWEWTCDASDVAAIRQREGEDVCEVQGLSPGTATVTGAVTFLVDTTEGEKIMTDLCSFQVTVEEPPAPETVCQKDMGWFGITSGYGYVSTFAKEWAGELPEDLVYTSSDESVLRVNPETGEFYTAAAGRAELIAADPSEPNTRYILTAGVQNSFQWDYVAWAPMLEAGQSGTCRFTDCYILEYTGPISAVWSSGDESVVTTTDSSFWQSNEVQGVQPGEALVTCTVTFEVETFEGPVYMESPVSFWVEVAP